MTTAIAAGDSLHRLVKSAIDSGFAASISEAEALFQSYALGLSIGASEARDPGHQAALLTGVALGRRVFLGGVSVDGAVNVPLQTPLPLGATLADAVIALGGKIGRCARETPRITIGGGPQRQAPGFHIRTAQAGWRGGVLPAAADIAPRGGPDMPLAAMLAAALAVNESFLHVSGNVSIAGRRCVGLSLWRPSADVDWLVAGADEPKLRFLPSRLWLIGLGHLGQAYMWGLGLLDYPDPRELALVLQDIDVITASTESTSVLSDASMVGQMKTRAVAAWAERRGFRTTISERLFDDSIRRQPAEPGVALCGLDNALGRQALDRVGFDLVVEAGLGRGHRDFRTIHLHTLPGARSAGEIWKGPTEGEKLIDRAAYRKMLDDGELDQCGVTLLAGKAVGGCFVGTIAACLALSEVLRLLHNGPMYSLIDLDLQSIEHRTVVSHPAQLDALNPGFVAIDA